jgi:hypothetical protein
MAKAARTTLGKGDANLALQIALGFYVAIGKVGEADGEMDEKEIEASFAVLVGLTKNSKSELLRKAAGLVSTGGRGFVILREADERSDNKILGDLGKQLRKAPIEDRYRFEIAFVVLCHAISKASGGGFLRGSPVSEAEEVEIGNMLALLWGAKLGTPPSSDYILFAKSAEIFCAANGM